MRNFSFLKTEWHDLHTAACHDGGLRRVTKAFGLVFVLLVGIQIKDRLRERRDQSAQLCIGSQISAD